MEGRKAPPSLLSPKRSPGGAKGLLIALVTILVCACIAVPVLYFTTDIFNGGTGPSGAGEGSQTTPNPGIRVILNKAQALEDCEPWVKGKGEFYFVVVVTDGHKFSELRIPSSGYYPLQDGGTAGVNKVCFSTSEVGDYIQVVIAGFEQDSGICYGQYVFGAASLLGDYLVPGAGTGASVLLAIIEEQRGGEGFWCDEDDYAGGCDRTWYSSQNWGVGSHQLADKYMRFWITIEQY